MLFWLEHYSDLYHGVEDGLEEFARGVLCDSFRLLGGEHLGAFGPDRRGLVSALVDVLREMWRQLGTTEGAKRSMWVLSDPWETDVEPDVLRLSGHVDWGDEDGRRSNQSWSDFAIVEARSIAGRCSVRAKLASGYLGPLEKSAPELRLFRLACRASLHPKADATQLETELAAYHGDPLWPALARHISRRSTAEDRALLEELAAKPELREGVLSWGLRYYVRGDLVLNDGTVLTLDQLCDELGLPHLPLLEDMPDELPEDLFEALSGDDDTAITARPREPSSN